MRRLLILVLLILFAISASSAEIYLKSGRVVVSDDLPWVSGDVLKFHMDGQVAAVYLTLVDFDKTRIREASQPKSTGHASAKASPEKTQVQKPKVITNEDLEKLNKDVQMGDNSRMSVPVQETESSPIVISSGSDWPGFDSAAGGNPGESLDEIQQQLEANQQDLDTGGDKFARRFRYRGSGSAIDQKSYRKEKQKLLEERKELLEKRKKLGGDSRAPDPILDRPKPPRQDPGSQVSADATSTEVPTTSAGDELTVRTY